MNSGNINVHSGRDSIHCRCISHVIPQFTANYYWNRFIKPRRSPVDFNDGRIKRGSVPLLGEKASSYTDPLPQALILTAIVISFGVTSFSLY